MASAKKLQFDNLESKIFTVFLKSKNTAQATPPLSIFNFIFSNIKQFAASVELLFSKNLFLVLLLGYVSNCSATHFSATLDFARRIIIGL